MVFLTLHPFNLIVALAARLFGPVAYWRCEGLPAWLLAPFEAIDPGKFSDSASWNGLLQEAHAALAPHVTQAPPLPVSTEGVTADLGPLWLHWFALRFEADFLGQHLAAAWARARGSDDCRMASSGVARWAEVARIGLVGIVGVRRVPGSALADGLWELAKSLRGALASLIRCSIAYSPGDLRRRRFRYLLSGTQPSGKPYEPGQLDFAFLVRHKLLPANECLYVTSRPLSAAQASALEETGGSAVSGAAVAGLVAGWDRVRLVLGLLAVVVQCVVRHGRAGDALAGMLARGFALFAVGRQKGVAAMAIGLDEGLLESAAVLLLSAAGVRTITWQHALVGFAHAPNGSTFRGRVLEQSVFTAQTVCVWTSADRYLLHDRALLPASQLPAIRVTGPVMSGQSSWLKRAPAEARRAARLTIGPERRLVAVFDLPTFADGVLRSYRIAITRISRFVQDAFFDDLATVLRAFPDLDIALKPKRDASDPRFYVGPACRNLAHPEGEWRRASRVHVVDFDIDPYLPIAAADLVIGMPFTSPVAAALDAGKPALWYDPTGFVGTPYPPELDHILVRGRERLMERLAAWRSGASFAPPACLVSGISDPGAAFASTIMGGTEDQPAASRLPSLKGAQG